MVACNARLRERFRGEPRIHLVNWDYLRDEEWSSFKSDRKHIKISATPFFAGGYIAALRRAHNLPPKNQRHNTGHKKVYPLMDNLIPHPTSSSRINTSSYFNQSRNKQSTYNTQSYHNVPPPPPEPRTLNNNIPSTVFPVPPPPMQPSSSFSTFATTPQPVHPNVPAKPYEQTGINGNKSLIGDRLKRLACSSPQIDDDKKLLVKRLCGLLECMDKW